MRPYDDRLSVGRTVTSRGTEHSVARGNRYLMRGSRCYVARGTNRMRDSLAKQEVR